MEEKGVNLFFETSSKNNVNIESVCFFLKNYMKGLLRNSKTCVFKSCVSIATKKIG